MLSIDLETVVGSDISRVEQPVTGRLRRAVVVTRHAGPPDRYGVSGTCDRGAASRQGQGPRRDRDPLQRSSTRQATDVARLATATISRMAPATKQKDALEIIAPAAGGALVRRPHRRWVKAPRKGAAIGGAAGTGYVLSTRGKEVRLGHGARLAVKLTAPLHLKVRS